MKVLFVVPESYPFARTGGLGEVAYSLSKEMIKQGIDVRVIMPKYSRIHESFKNKMKTVNVFNVSLGWREQYCGLEMLLYEDIPYYFIDNEYYFKRDALYGFFDEAERYAFFCRAVLESIKYMDFTPNIIHTHDWQTGMVNALLKLKYRKKEVYKNIQSVFTIHNLFYQGVFPVEILEDFIDLPSECFNVDGIEFYGAVSFMKAGISYADKVTTVSPTYSKEIQTPYLGEKLDDFLRKNSYKLEGILNGIDYKVYNPYLDDFIYQKYHKKMLKKKATNKIELQKELGLKISENIPMISMVTRLVKQKGIDLVLYILEELITIENIQLVILGIGDDYYENQLKNIACKYPDKISLNLCFDETMSHKIYAGSDFLLMPSLFEPCGISQLIALKYGTIPIVRETGGLIDTIRSFNEDTNDGNGFLFSNFNAHDMLYTIRRALKVYRADKEIFLNIIQSAMECDFSWKSSAKQYKNIYNEILLSRKGT